MSIASDLLALGFKPSLETDDGGDFVCRNDSDGGGDYIEFWLSDKRCPFPDLIREPR